MTDFPNIPSLPLFVSTFTRYCSAFEVGTIASTTTSAAFAWATANLGVFYPVVLPWPYPVQRVFWANGTTASLNANFGIYTADLVQLYSTGSTAQTGPGTSVIQYVSPTVPFVLPPGRYYFGFALSNTTAGCAYGAGGRDLTSCRLAGFFQQATQIPMSASLTPAALATGNIQLCGITRKSAGF